MSANKGIYRKAKYCAREYSDNLEVLLFLSVCRNSNILSAIGDLESYSNRDDLSLGTGMPILPTKVLDNVFPSLVKS
jgi:hypothetical protein